MKRINGYTEELTIDNEKYIVSIVKTGKGLKAVYNCFITNKYYYSCMMFGWPIDQRQAKEPHIYTPDEIMELALFDAKDNILFYQSEFSRMESEE